MSQEDTSSSKQPVNYQVLIPQEYYGGHQDDEISLVELFLILWRKRFWIMGLTAIITVISIFYALSLSPVYQTKTYLLPPDGGDIAALNLFVAEQKGGQTKAEHTTASVFKKALANITSRPHQWEFFEKNDLIKLYVKQPNADVRARDIFNGGFRPSLKIESKEGEQSVLFTYGDKQVVAQILNQYIAFIHETTVMDLLEDVNDSAQFEQRQIEQQIEQLRQNALLQRQDKIEQLKVAIELARKLNIQTNNKVGPSVTADGKEVPPHYSEGVKALQVRLDAITNRKTDDAYIPELRSLQARLAVLAKAVIDPSQVRAFNVDQEALEPKYPIKPKKRLIVILGFIVGVMLSIFAAFVWNFIEKYREEQGY